MTTPYLGASESAIQHHYDLSTEFYRLWLDPTLTYSCALWESADDTLESAQLNKLDYLARKANAPGARRVLDVGFGWGGFLRRLVETHGVERVVGLTLSADQAASVTQWADDRYELRLESWSEHRPDAPYDAIVSVGAMEHFATLGMSQEQRLDAYRSFFTACRDWLPPGGRLAVQTIVRGHNLDYGWDVAREMIFINREIFRESEVPWFAEVLRASEGLFEPVSIRNDAAHYARTCRCWLERLEANNDEAVAMVGAEAVRKYHRYLRASIRVFDSAHAGLARMIFERHG